MPSDACAILVDVNDPHDLVIDKSAWIPGPWQQEPDRVQWRTGAGLPGLIVRNWSGALCGYAGVSAAHPDHGIGYNECPQGCEDGWCEHSPESRYKVHGGLTYAAACQVDGPVCHVPEPGEPDDVWWFGFDCSHAGDYSPGSESRCPPNLRAEAYGIHGTYRDLAYVRAQVESLAAQLMTQP